MLLVGNSRIDNKTVPMQNIFDIFFLHQTLVYDCPLEKNLKGRKCSIHPALCSRINLFFRTNSTFQRVSTLVTTVFDGPIESQIEIAIKFYDLIMAKNDTRLGNLKCASVNLPKGYIDFDTKKLKKNIFDL